MYVWDLENTLTNSEHRNHLAVAKDYDSFHALFHLDRPRKNNVGLYCACRKQHTTIILTGMMEKYRVDAINWLNQYNLMPDALFMRANDDYRPSPEFKIDVIKNFSRRPYMVFDDREDVVTALLLHGYPAIMVAP